MEQLRVVLEKLKKYHFWILCGLIVLITFGVWFTATSTGQTPSPNRSRRTKKRSATRVKSAASKTKPTKTTTRRFRSATLASWMAIPKKRRRCRKSLAGLKPQRQRQHRQRAAFRRPAQRQSAAGYLCRRPNAEGLRGGVQKGLEPSHRANRRQRKEARRPEARRITLLPQFRDRYRDRIKDEVFPQLFEMVELRNRLDNNGDPCRAAGPWGPAAPERQERQVFRRRHWPDAEQLKNWFHNWDDWPSTLEVMIAQEDLWVYEALLRVIRNTNNNDPKHEPKNYQSPGRPEAGPHQSDRGPGHRQQRGAELVGQRECRVQLFRRRCRQTTADRQADWDRAGRFHERRRRQVRAFPAGKPLRRCRRQTVGRLPIPTRNSA